jgi:hypothetical protein
MSCIFYNRTMQRCLHYYQHPVRFLQAIIRRLSSFNRQKTIANHSYEGQKAKWYQNGLNRSLLSNTDTFKKRNIFLM